MWLKKANSIIVYRGDNQSMDIGSFDFSHGLKSGKELGGTMSEGPGMYFTTDEQNARAYGKYITEIQITSDSNFIDSSASILNEQKIKSILGDVDTETLEIALSNWDEDANIAMGSLLESIMNASNAQDQLINIWAEVFYHQNPEEFANVMVKNGIDGIIVNKDGSKHYVVYNRNILKSV